MFNRYLLHLRRCISYKYVFAGIGAEFSILTSGCGKDPPPVIPSTRGGMIDVKDGDYKCEFSLRKREIIEPWVISMLDYL